MPKKSNSYKFPRNEFKRINFEELKKYVKGENKSKEYNKESQEDFSVDEIAEDLNKLETLINAKKIVEGSIKLTCSNLKKKKAYLVTFKERNDIAYISFASDRGKARWRACKYFKDILIPEFQRDKGYSAQLRLTIARRVKEFDCFADKERVPIPELMKILNFKFPCSICGKELFSYRDYEAERCFYLEGEDNLNEFVEGIILCYSCKKKYLL